MRIYAPSLPGGVFAENIFEEILEWFDIDDEQPKEKPNTQGIKLGDLGLRIKVPCARKNGPRHRVKVGFNQTRLPFTECMAIDHYKSIHILCSQ